MNKRIAITLALALATAACGHEDAVCLTLPNPSVNAEIRDSLSGAPAAYGASLVLVGDQVYDSTFVGPRPDSASVFFVSSVSPRRTGNYTVRVRKPGYRLWQKDGVHLEGDGCGGAKSAFLLVRLQRLP